MIPRLKGSTLVSIQYVCNEQEYDDNDDDNEYDDSRRLSKLEQTEAHTKCVNKIKTPERTAYILSFLNIIAEISNDRINKVNPFKPKRANNFLSQILLIGCFRFYF